MQKVAVITDSIACLPREFIEQYKIKIIPINLYAGGKIYKDGVDITPSQAYELFLKDPESFKTSAPSPNDCLEAFREASKHGKDILCVTVSIKLSMVFNSSLEAKELAKTELPKTNIEIMDSLTATASEGLVALAAARAAAEGKNLAEVIGATKKVRDKVGALLLLDTIRHVYRSGRIPKIASQAGSLLHIRPVLAISEVVHFAGAVRNREQGIKRILHMMGDKVGQRPAHIAVMHAYAPDEAERLMKLVSSEFNCAEVWLTECSPVIGYALGTGTLGLAFYTEDTR